MVVLLRRLQVPLLLDAQYSVDRVVALILLLLLLLAQSKLLLIILLLIMLVALLLLVLGYFIVRVIEARLGRASLELMILC